MMTLFLVSCQTEQNKGRHKLTQLTLTLFLSFIVVVVLILTRVPAMVTETKQCVRMYHARFSEISIIFCVVFEKKKCDECKTS